MAETTDSQGTSRPVDFEEAIAYLRQKVDLPTARWTDLWEGMHARAFVVAGAMADSLVADFRAAVAKALEQGTTLAEFRRDFDRIVAAHGWTHHGTPAWRAGVIYHTNLRMAYAAGRWQQIQRLRDARPWLRYVAILDGRTRPQHAAWHDTVLPVDNPFWAIAYPPNGWNCRCYTQSVARDDLDRYGLRVAKQAPELQWEDRMVTGADGPVTVRVPHGIDPGFGYNVRIAGFGRGAQAVALERNGRWAAHPPACARRSAATRRC